MTLPRFIAVEHKPEAKSWVIWDRANKRCLEVAHDNPDRLEEEDAFHLMMAFNKKDQGECKKRRSAPPPSDSWSDKVDEFRLRDGTLHVGGQYPNRCLVAGDALPDFARWLIEHARHGTFGDELRKEVANDD